MDSHGQTSLEILMIIGFTLILGLMIGIPFLENQTRTNAAIQTKLSVLPFVEKNTHLVKIASITASVSPSPPKILSVAVRTKGALDSSIGQELDDGACASICSQIDPGGYFGGVSFVWDHNSTNECSASC
jgi:hypothetical protein